MRALGDAAESADWRCDMAHLPVIATAAGGESVLVVKQERDGATFVGLRGPSAGDSRAARRRAGGEGPRHPVGPFDPPTIAEIARDVGRRASAAAGRLSGARVGSGGSRPSKDW